ncbi:hypothetical protein MNB_SUP05-SYMBIONT-4-974 [hydrothermal vent metagenome]|uniref:Uncharacterized protein n=1 Tax=hydrothermal vent metagenome TaxID=652676 RepID=A0A1W1DZ69_9ZZZZ
MGDLNLLLVPYGYLSVIVANILIKRMFNQPTFLEGSKVNSFVLMSFVVLLSLLLHAVYGDLNKVSAAKLMIELFIFIITFLGFRKYAYMKFVLGFNNHKMGGFYG